MTTSTEPQFTPEATGPVLTPVLNHRFALTLGHVATTALLAALLIVLGFLPLRNTDIWSHVGYGRWILEHNALPTQDPWMPLAEGMRVVDTMWLSQVLLAKVEDLFGAVGLSNVFALTEWLTFALLARAFFLTTRRLGPSMLGAVIVFVVGWSRVATIRPEMFSLLALSILAWLLARDREKLAGQRRWELWIALPVLFMVWANLHGTFACGLALLGCHVLGRTIEVAWQTRSVRDVLTDSSLRRWVWLTELAAAATLINPYGIDLWIEAATFSFNLNLKEITEWTPLTILGIGGREFAFACVLIMLLLRFSRRSVAPAAVLLVSLFAVAAISQVRMMGWFAPVLGIVLVPHLAEIWNRLRPTAAEAVAEEFPALPPGRSWRYSMCCVVLVWLAFCFSGFSRPLLGGAPRKDSSLYSDATPLGLSRYLRQHPPQGQIYNPQWWGDWLVFDGPAGLQPFAMTHVHLLPRQAWKDYQRIGYAESGWETTLDRYHVTTIIVDKKNQPLLLQAVTRTPGWVKRYEDEESLLLTRAVKSAKPAAETKSASTEPATTSAQGAVETKAAEPNPTKP